MPRNYDRRVVDRVSPVRRSAGASVARGLLLACHPVPTAAVTLIGVLIMVMIRNGLNLMGVSPFWQGSAIGSIIIVALLVESIVSRRVSR